MIVSLQRSFYQSGKILELLLQAGTLTSQFTQVIQAGAANLAVSLNNYFGDTR